MPRLSVGLWLMDWFSFFGGCLLKQLVLLEVLNHVQNTSVLFMTLQELAAGLGLERFLRGVRQSPFRPRFLWVPEAMDRVQPLPFRMTPETER